MVGEQGPYFEAGPATANDTVTDNTPRPDNGAAV